MLLRTINSKFLVYASFYDVSLPTHSLTVSATSRSDPVVYAIRDALCLRYLADPAVLAGRQTPAFFDKSIRFEESKPLNPGYSPIVDSYDYGRGLYTLFTGNFRGAKARVDATNEQLCKHVRALGTYDYVPLDLSYYNASDTESSIWGVVFPSLSTDPFGRVSLGDRLDINNNDVSVAYHPHAHARYYIWDVLNAYRERLDSAGENSVGHQFYVDGYDLFVSLESLSYKMTSTSIEIDYVVRYRRKDIFFNNVVTELKKSSKIVLRRVQTDQHIVDSVYSTEPFDKLDWLYNSRFHDYANLGYEFPLWHDLDETEMVDRGDLSTCVVISNLAVNHQNSDDIVSARNLVGSEFEQFSSKVGDAHADITAGNFYSTSNALHEWLDIISANMIEFCSELGNIASLLPSVAGLARVYRNARNLNLLALGASILDVASDIKLWWDFGVKPNITTLSEFVEKHDELFSRMPDLTGSRILYGDFDYSTDDWYISYRSKIRIRLDNSILLQAITGFNALGFLPSPGQFWDAVPFSFVVDWFFNIGGKLDAVDTQGMLLVLPCDVGTHSYKVETKGLPIDLSAFNFHPSGDDPPRFVYYYRGVSVVLPSLRQSAYDFTPPNPPPWDTGLAFIYKIMKW